MVINKTDIGRVSLAWLGWRVALAIVAVLGSKWLPYQPSFPYAYTLLPGFGLPQWLYSWANFDGVHYLTIATKGYLGTGLIQAFFPVFPGLVAGATWFLHNPLLAGLVVSQLGSWLAAVTWFGLVSEVKDKKIAWWSSIAWWVFPTSFFLGAVYSEGIFMCLVFGCFWAAHRQKWWLAGGLAAVASATRVVGVALVPSLLWYWWQNTQNYTITPKTLKAWAGICFGATGLLLYMAYLWKTFHDPLYFFHVQSEFGSGRQETLVTYPQVVWRYIKILVTYQPHDWKYWAFVQEAVVGVGGILALVWAARRSPSAWSVFAVIAFFLPTLTGTFSSLPRYVLVCLPLWLALGEVLTTHRWLRWGYLLGSASVLAVNMVLFYQGYWVA